MQKTFKCEKCGKRVTVYSQGATRDFTREIGEIVNAWYNASGVSMLDITHGLKNDCKTSIVDPFLARLNAALDSTRSSEKYHNIRGTLL